jgi:hypothetical protein
MPISICRPARFNAICGIDNRLDQHRDNLMSIALLWFGLSLAAGVAAESRGRSGVGWFFLSLIISPILGLIFVLVMNRVDTADGLSGSNGIFEPDAIHAGIPYRVLPDGSIEAIMQGSRVKFANQEKFGSAVGLILPELPANSAPIYDNKWRSQWAARSNKSPNLDRNPWAWIIFIGILVAVALLATDHDSLSSRVPFGGPSSDQHKPIASGKIPYGSRVGMAVSILSATGLDTSRAVIRTKHTREDAVAFCRDYVQKISDECINRELAIAMNNSVEANCSTGEFVDFFGDHHRFEGPLKKHTQLQMAGYAIRDLASNEIEDGSSSSGYTVNLSIIHALCPKMAPDSQ